MPTRKIYTDPSGNTYTALPRIWNNTSPITEAILPALGWTISTEEYTPTPEPIDPELRQRELAFVTQLLAFAAELHLAVESLDITVAGLTAAAQSAGATDTRILQMQTSLLSLSFDIAACSDHGWKQTWGDFKKRIPDYVQELNA